jgi:hypothetical protein
MLWTYSLRLATAIKAFINIGCWAEEGGREDFAQWTPICSHSSVYNHAHKPKNKCRCLTPWHSLFLTCWKNMQYSTIIYNVQYLHVGFLNAKNPLLWVLVFNARCELPSTLDPCWKLTAPFPTSRSLQPFPKPTPVTPQVHKCNTILTSRRRHIGLSDIFLIQYTRIQKNYYILMTPFQDFLQISKRMPIK